MTMTTAANTLVRRCFSTTLTRRCVRVPTGMSSSSRLATPPVAINNSITSCAQNSIVRSFSAMPPPPTATPPNAATAQPPASITAEAGLGALGAMRLFVEHGLGKRKLDEIAAEKDTSPLVHRWQKMIATYLESQCHVIALLGYRPDETGIALYSQHLTEALRLSPPDLQEEMRVAGRDNYRMVLAGAFDVPSLVEEQKERGELSVVDARNIMHKVSLRMQDPEVLEKVAKRCGTYAATNDSPEARQIELSRKHTAVQETMVDDVYLSRKEGGASLVEECGFGEGEGGYVRMQSAMTEHQGDPLIAEYMSAAMTRLLQSAGIDIGALQRGEAA
mmetsp:Transcript_54889/g.116617  ORF Transcript_54889/g.116617 Transcript_54889/m.116617 type:complete len:333 (-) Transcript_54889:78-1076(-)